MHWMSFAKQLWNNDKQVFHIFAFVLSIYLLPLQWMCAAAVAALIHELGHYVAVRLFGGEVHNVRFNMFGAVMEATDLKNYAELICLIAGPVAGLLPLLTFRFFPTVALCGIIQSAYNLLPIYPLDGGKILQRIILMSGGNEDIFLGIEYIVVLVLFFVCVYIWIRFRISLFLFFLVFLFRKTPCKQH